MKNPVCIALAAAALAFIPHPSFAYEIGSGGAVPKHDIHEVITELAMECVTRSANEPADCSDLHSEIAIRAEQNRPTADPSLTYATRWPDDPQRTLDQTATQGRFAIDMELNCPGKISGGATINFTGLLCASHYGRLQFMHAMMPPDHPGALADQRDLILSWADFAFRAGTDTEFANQDYCETVAALKNSDLRAALEFSNADSPRSFCFERKKRFLFIRLKTYAPWRVSTLFRFTCREPFRLSTCGYVAPETAQIAARGAVLHLIQDSFSQSHVSRTQSGAPLPPTGPFTAAVVCQPGARFYVYQEQTGARDYHQPADILPDLDDSCGAPDRRVDDVITASAKAIYFMNNGDRSGFNTYLSQRVFP